MAKPKFKSFRSETFQIMVHDGMKWHARDRIDGKESVLYDDLARYSDLKRTWRRCRPEFDKKCAMLQYESLFTKAGITL